MTESRTQKRKPYKINWFKFYPSDLIEIIEMTDAEAGKRIKQFIKNLMQNRAPQGTIEERMLQEAGEFSRRQSERIATYWKNKRDNSQQQRKQDSCQEFKPPPSPAMAKMNKR